MRRAQFVVLASILGGGCAGDPGDSGDTDVTDTDTDVGAACFADAMALTAGTGASGFLPLAPGDPVTIVHGPQGGWHIETAGSAEHAGQEVSILSKVTVVATGTAIAGSEPDDLPEFKALANYDDLACSGQFWAVRAFVDDVVTPPGGLTYQQFVCSLEGQELDLEITIDDLANDRTATSSVRVTVLLDPADVPVCN